MKRNENAKETRAIYQILDGLKNGKEYHCGRHGYMQVIDGSIVSSSMEKKGKTSVDIDGLTYTLMKIFSVLPSEFLELFEAV